MSGITEAILYLAIVAIIAVVAIRLGMLLAPRLDRWTAPDEEDDGNHSD